MTFFSTINASLIHIIIFVLVGIICFTTATTLQFLHIYVDVIVVDFVNEFVQIELNANEKYKRTWGALAQAMVCVLVY